MSDDSRKKGFWGGLFRTKSSATGSGKLEKAYPRRASEGDVLARHRKSENLSSAKASASSSDRRRPRRPDTGAAKGKGKGREEPNGSAYHVGPLTEWPPAGMSSAKELTLGAAMQLIATGVPRFKGHKRSIPHASDHYFALFATAAGNGGDETDAANPHDAMTQLMTLRLLGSGPALDPWETLEQPSFSFCYGRRPGTVTLNHWASIASQLPPAIALRDPGIVPRDIGLDLIFERLQDLERRGLEDDDDDLMYRNLYRKLLRDPDKYRSPHKTLDKQITDLIMVLSRADWIDFTNPKNQIPTTFIFDTDMSRSQTYRSFFHQLLLSVELDARINSRLHLTEAKEKLLHQIPPTIQWNLALARRWRDNVRVDDYGPTPAEVRLRFKLKKRQVKVLKRFAQIMKWPNLGETLESLRDRDARSTLDVVSSHTMAFFSGLVLPGPTFPFLIMNTLIDMDPDPATDELAMLMHTFPSCGFQYRSSYTYWTATSVVGKVLAPTCHAIAGWVGPARPTADLGRSQIARIRSRRPLQRVTDADVNTVTERSDPLGPMAQVFPVNEYTLVSPDRDDDGYLANLVRIEVLSLRPVPAAPVAATASPVAAAAATPASGAGPRLFDASLQFAIDGVSWPLRLTFDVNFVNAWPCTDGPHPLFFDYVYTCVKADELVSIRDWNGQYGGHPHDRSARSLSPAAAAAGGASLPTAKTASADAAAGGAAAKLGSSTATSKSSSLTAASSINTAHSHSHSKNQQQQQKDGRDRDSLASEDEEKVLVVEAFGVADNEVLARAWCSHWGLSAVVADIGKTCMACAIREAFAATLTVVILVDDDQNGERDN
ncbi:hypothetical protein B0T24DRAFT_334544 [Lasiosphaeria ovina]|uniref:VTC domain-containing protein n=1 Tax=Lasiosphaeria ovina TaxID=92902 RepID=A0AAE0N6X6_9PEZI|nr:hypothetical protein B0T24DRAFT_334544 [Lasiosphaeria ovina]